MISTNNLIPSNESCKAPFYRSLQLNENRVIIGILLSTKCEPDRTDLILIPDDYAPQSEINYGWRLGDDGNWHPPEPLTEIEIFEQEIALLKGQISTMYHRKQYANWLCVNPDSPEGRALLPEPDLQLPEPPKEDPNLLVAFARIGGILTPELEAEIKKMPHAATAAFDVSSYLSKISKLSKDELFALLKAGTERLSELKEDCKSKPKRMAKGAIKK